MEGGEERRGREGRKEGWREGGRGEEKERDGGKGGGREGGRGREVIYPFYFFRPAKVGEGSSHSENAKSFQHW